MDLTRCWCPAPSGDGTYALRAQAQDVAGNSSAQSTAFNLTIDATPPVGFSFASGFGAVDVKALAVATDASNNLYVTGAFKGFATFGQHHPQQCRRPRPVRGQVFTGCALIWVDAMAGKLSTSVGQGSAITVDSAGNVYAHR